MAVKPLPVALRRAVWTLGMLVGALHSSALAAETPGAKTVLAVYSLQRESPLTSLFDSSLHQAFRAAPGLVVDYYSEYLDSRRFSSASDSRRMREYLRQKYSSRNLDVIVVFGSAAAELLIKNRGDLFPNVPVVFCAVDGPELSNSDSLARTGLLWGTDHRSTLDVALRLHPNTSDVFVVLAPPPETPTFVDDIQRELREFDERVAIHYLIDVPTADIISTLNSGPPGAIVLYVRQSTDAAGKRVTALEALDVIARAVNLPIYSAFDAYLGHGIVGGYMFSSSANGTRVGEMALRVANGSRTEDIPVERAVAVPQFDWRQLQRWRIRNSQLPMGGGVLFRQLTFWDEYRRYIVAAASLFAIQMGLTGALLIQRGRRRRAERAWRDSEERYRSFVKLQPELVCHYRPDLTLTYANDAYCRFWGKTPAELIGTKFIDLLPEDVRDEVRAYVQSLVERPRADTHEVEIRRPDGTTFWQQWIDRVIVDGDGRAIELQGIGKDIAERKRSEDALQHSEARNRAILRALPDMMFLTSRDGVFLDYQAKDPRDLFVPPERFLGKNIRDVMPPYVSTLFMNSMERAVESDEPCIIDYDLQIAGEDRHFELRVVSCENDKILSIVRDVTERRRAEKALRDNKAALQATNEEIRHLGGRLIAAQEVERRRIARELHDDLSQKLALLTMELDHLSQGALAAEVVERLRKLTDQAGQIATDVHRLSYQLHPSKLEALGLVACIRSFCREIADQHPIDVTFTHNDVPARIPPEVSLGLFRIVQEALHNVVKHSGAKHALVHLTGADDGLQLQIVDLGVGFTLAAHDGRGLGLVSMRERVLVLGGQLEIHSAPGQGTRIGVNVPFDVPVSESGTPSAEVRTA
jgi:PAS domain S-box-containing protein